MRAPSYLRLAVLAAASATLASSVAAQQPLKIDPADPFHCVAHSGFFNERGAEIMRPWTVASGSLVFHEAHPDCDCGRAGVSVLFSDSTVDPDKEHGIGFSAVIRPDDPKVVHLLLMSDGDQQPIGDYAYGTTLPFKVAFDESAGTMTVTAGKFTVTTKPPHLRHSSLDVPCMSADVSVADLRME